MPKEAQEPIVISAPELQTNSASRQEAMNQFLAAETERAKAASPAVVEAPEAQGLELDAPKEHSKASKAAAESKALRAAKAKEQKLVAELEKARGSASAVEELAKVKQLFADNPKEAIKLLGSNPLQTYQALTENLLSGDIELKEKNPLEEKVKEHDTYLETIKKLEARVEAQETAKNVSLMIADHISPTVLSKEAELECLFDFVNPEGKLTQAEARKQVEQIIYQNGEEYFLKTMKGDHQKILSEYGNYAAYFLKVAEHLDKQLEQQVDQWVRKAQKLSRFNKAKGETNPSSAAPDHSQPDFAIVPARENNQKPATQYATRSSTPSRMEEIEAFLKSQSA